MENSRPGTTRQRSIYGSYFLILIEKLAVAHNVRRLRRRGDEPAGALLLASDHPRAFTLHTEGVPLCQLIPSPWLVVPGRPADFFTLSDLTHRR